MKHGLKMFFQSEENFLCAICQNIFTDPVVLLCSHSFCKNCLQSWWRWKQIQQCPLCMEVNAMSDPPRNLALKNLCENFVMERDQSCSGEAFCSLHAERLKLFCLDHQEPVCVVCRDSKVHRGHSFSPVDEAAKDHREGLKESLNPLRNKLKIFQQVKGNCDQTAEYIKVQARNTEKLIKEQFKKLHKFLEEEEEFRIWALRDEEKKKSRTMKEKIEGLNREIAALSETIRVIENELRADDSLFLQNYKAAVKRVQQRPLLKDPELVSEALINEAKHLGNLSYNIWNKMKTIVSYSPVILDPNSAHPELVLSNDLTGVSNRDTQKLPHNPERFEYHPIVVSSEGFISGAHSWDVEVINEELWSIGVIQESVKKKVQLVSGSFELAYFDGKFVAASPPDPDKFLSLKTKPKKIRVHLDYDKGKLSFFDLQTNTFIHTYTHTFTERLFPFVCTLNKVPVKILPVSL
ncbi:zinc-binding protein A33-like [Halichoeres trimaculatus]|uniref:zinc-binding protein A33-like n=1 Tax=Halichoeres trimaculatus TaxID=147232 RepID=UPI003D9FB031